MPVEAHLRLAPLLERRKRIEEEKQQRWALRLRERDESARGVDVLMAAQRSSLGQSVPVAYLAALDAAVTRRVADSAEAGTKLDQARQQLLAAARDRKAIEILQQRRRCAHEAEAARREEAELDEANARRLRVSR